MGWLYHYPSGEEGGNLLFKMISTCRQGLGGGHQHPVVTIHARINQQNTVVTLASRQMGEMGGRGLSQARRPHGAGQISDNSGWYYFLLYKKRWNRIRRDYSGSGSTPGSTIVIIKACRITMSKPDI
jgi:hypothetical protein